MTRDEANAFTCLDAGYNESVVIPGCVICVHDEEGHWNLGPGEEIYIGDVFYSVLVNGLFHYVEPRKPC